MLVKVELVQLDTALLATEVKPATANDSAATTGLSGGRSVANSGSSAMTIPTAAAASAAPAACASSKSRRAPPTCAAALALATTWLASRSAQPSSPVAVQIDATGTCIQVELANQTSPASP